MNEFLGFAALPAITVVCYFAAQVVKATAVDNKWLPVVCGALGAVLGVVGKLTMEAFPAGDVVTAIAIGIVSGLAATGANQIYRQLKGTGAPTDSEQESDKGGE